MDGPFAGQGSGFLFAFSYFSVSFGGKGKVVAKGPNCPKNKGKLGIFGPPRPNKDMPTPCPYILILLTPQGAAAEGRGPLFCLLH